MPVPELAVVAQGDLPGGQRWILRAGGSREDYYTFLETIYPGGYRDEGGLGGPLLYPGSLLNTYTGGDDHGLHRVVVRADPRVARLRLSLASGEQLDLAPVATDAGLGVSFFAALLPWTAGLDALTPLDSSGQPLEPYDLTHHEQARRRFDRRRRPGSGDDPGGGGPGD